MRAPAVAGIWTPWAQTLCVPCHNGTKGQSTLRPFAPREPHESERRGALCDTCGCEITLDADVAVLGWLRRRLCGGRLEQTGGMCSALVYPRPDGRVIVATVDGAAVVAYVYETMEAWTEQEGETETHTPWTSIGEAPSWRSAFKMLRDAMPEPCPGCEHPIVRTVGDPEECVCCFYGHERGE